MVIIVIISWYEIYHLKIFHYTVVHFSPGSSPLSLVKVLGVRLTDSTVYMYRLMKYDNLPI